MRTIGANLDQPPCCAGGGDGGDGGDGAPPGDGGPGGDGDWWSGEDGDDGHDGDPPAGPGTTQPGTGIHIEGGVEIAPGLIPVKPYLKPHIEVVL